jgi:prevent-host-death family protein
MREVGSYEAKTHLPELLSAVAKGERITITKHGVPIAIIIPVEQSRSKEIGSAIAKIKQMRNKLTLGGLSVRDLINEGRRF